MKLLKWLAGFIDASAFGLFALAFVMLYILGSWGYEAIEKGEIDDNDRALQKSSLDTIERVERLYAVSR